MHNRIGEFQIVHHLRGAEDAFAHGVVEPVNRHHDLGAGALAGAQAVADGGAECGAPVKAVYAAGQEIGSRVRIPPRHADLAGAAIGWNRHIDPCKIQRPAILGRPQPVLRWRTGGSDEHGNGMAYIYVSGGQGMRHQIGARRTGRNKHENCSQRAQRPARACL